MTSERGLTRETIIRTLADALKPLDYVHAFWEGGAVAFHRIDDWSDIDLYLVVDDKKVGDTFHAVERALRSLSPIKRKHGIFEPSPGLFQAFYKLRDASEYLLIDIAVFKLSCPDKFLETEIHGNPAFHFNKSDEVKPSPLDKDAFVEKLQKTLVSLQGEFDIFHLCVQKEINRDNHLEAVDFYHMLLAWLVQVLRIRYNPLHYDFKMRYIHYELPSEIIRKLERLYFVKDEEDLQKKYDETVEWFPKIISEIDQNEIKKLMRT
jgi:hypothetical protein